MVFYLATSPDLFVPIAEKIGAHGLNQPRARIVLEKPIGKNAASALTVNEGIGAVFPEASIYRIDHYLGKETVQNLMALRFGNALFEPLWNASHIDNVQITVAEELGVEGRAGYYDTAGAMRDMVQNHMLQLLCLVAMEPPSVHEGGCGARREAEGAESPEAHRRVQRRPGDGAGPVQGRRLGGRRRAGLPRRARGGERHRDLRVDQGRDRQLALGRRALLPAHRQAAAVARVRDRGDASARCRIRSSRARRPQPNRL